MSKDERDDLSRFGANARARGESFLSNPYLKSEALPASSGDTLEEWREKLDAWHLGWVIEDGMRS